MSAIANLTVFDGAATPVSHTLAPIFVRAEKGVVQALWREQLASLPTEAQVSLTAKSEVLKSGVVRNELNVYVPVMETVTNQNAAGYTAAPKVAYVDRLQTVSYQHPRSTITGRRLIRMLMVNVMNNVSTTVAAATSGMVSELIDSQVMPT